MSNYEELQSEENYQMDMELHNMILEEETNRSNGGGVGSIVIWLIAIGIVAYVILNIMGKI